MDLEFWTWDKGRQKVHVDKEFGNHLRKKRKFSAVYRDRTGKVVGFDFVIRSEERLDIKKLHRQFEKKKRAESVAKTAQNRQ
jgi:hypothetical protein